ncbi:MAG: hypothetical protein ABFD65_14620 [Candidatus Polarisedimenticolia bacterium]
MIASRGNQQPADTQVTAPDFEAAAKQPLNSGSGTGIRRFRRAQ